MNFRSVFFVQVLFEIACCVVAFDLGLWIALELSR